MDTEIELTQEIEDKWYPDFCKEVLALEWVGRPTTYYVVGMNLKSTCTRELFEKYAIFKETQWRKRGSVLAKEIGII